MRLFEPRTPEISPAPREILGLLGAKRGPSDTVCDIRDLIAERTGAKDVFLFQFDRRLSRFSIWSQEGPEGRREAVHRHDPLVLLAEREQRILYTEDWSSLPVPEGRPAVFSHLDVLVPLFVGTEMVGLLLLAGLPGDKKGARAGKDSQMESFLQSCQGLLGILLENLELRGLVIDDYASGLRSHEYFNLRLTDEVERAIRYGRKVSLLMIKVFPLSKVLQSMSPLASERLLRRLGSILLENTRRMNIVARFALDADIFQVMMPEISGDVARRQGEVLTRKLNKTLLEEGRGEIEIYYGSATYPDDAASRKLLTGKAFDVLKHSQAQGQRQKPPVGEKIAEHTVPEYIRELDIRSPEMISILETAHRIADSKSTILVQGETGVGKEVLAEFIHRHSTRHSKPLIKVNCGALPENLVESELFGHEKGAFTGAEIKRIGRFEQAHEGTIFLDEVGELTPLAQVKLLRIIEGKAFYRLGGTTPINTDVRIVAATNRDLLTEVQNGGFREDLYYRLNVVSFTIPPLRDRPEDIPQLITSFMQEFNRANETKVELMHPEAMDILYRYSWPGNVRELKNAIERAMILTGKTGTLLARCLPPSVLKGALEEPRDAAVGENKLPEKTVPSASSPSEPAMGEASLRFPDLNERQRRVIDYLRLHPTISNQEYVNLMRVSRRTCVRDLNGLIEKRLVVREGKKKACIYRLAEGL